MLIDHERDLRNIAKVWKREAEAIGEKRGIRKGIEKGIKHEKLSFAVTKTIRTLDNKWTFLNLICTFSTVHYLWGL